MNWVTTVKEDGRTWFTVDNYDRWIEFTRGEAGYEPNSYPCLVSERLVQGYCKRSSEFYVRYDV